MGPPPFGAPLFLGLGPHPSWPTHFGASTLRAPTLSGPHPSCPHPFSVFGSPPLGPPPFPHPTPPLPLLTLKKCPQLTVAKVGETVAKTGRGQGDPRLPRVSSPWCAYTYVNVWVHFGSILGPLLGPFWVHFGSTLGPLWVHFVSIFVHFGSILGPFWVHFGDASLRFRVSISI